MHEMIQHPVIDPWVEKKPFKNTALFFVYLHSFQTGCMYVRMYVRTYVRTYVCMYVCMYVYMYVCVYVCMYVCNVM